MMLLVPFTLLLQKNLVTTRYTDRIVNPDCPWCENRNSNKDVVFVPISAPVMRLLAPADPHFLADLLWLRTSYYFGHHALTNREYPYLFHLLDLITDLSSYWNWPYLFGAVILPTEAESVEEGLALIEKGLAYIPEDWRLWFFKGYYLWKYRGESIPAAEAFEKASRLPGAPRYLINLSATIATKAGQRQLALHFLKEALKTVQNPAQRIRLQKKIEDILSRD
jgi:tetratricopeptide (TPR) repeat protein